MFSLARMVLKGTVREGDTVRVRVEEGKLVIEENHPPSEEGGPALPRELEVIEEEEGEATR